MALKRQTIFALVTMVACCWPVAAAGARATPAGAPGTVDRSFGNEGTVAFGPERYPPSNEIQPVGEDMVVGPEDEIFVLQSLQGCQTTGCRVRFFVQRYLPDGRLDESFGREGASDEVVVETKPEPITRERSSFGSLAVGSRGEPVLATADQGDIVLFRFDRFGRLVPRFGEGGAARIDSGGVASGPRLAVLPDERIVVAGGVAAARGKFVVLARLLPNGQADPGFGPITTAGRRGWTMIPGRFPGALAAWGSGAIALAGSRCCVPASVRSVYTARRRSDGSLPTAARRAQRPWRFLRVGKHARVSSVIPLPGGKLYLVGATRERPFAVRMRASGRLDRSFGRGGRVFFPKMEAGASPAVADAAERLYVTGRHHRAEEYSAPLGVLARTTSRGRHDLRWGTKATGYSYLGGVTQPLALDFQSDGKLVVFGEQAYECIRSCLQPGWALTRVHADPSPCRR
ncbi:MAG TPA: hypothetical protein VKA35_05510 [Solirubrobacterales bacterium]|nr:hypothetical protein [Solirubrobacterales bacterium]